MQVHVHDHSLSSCLYFHFQSRCLAAVFRSSGIRKTGATSEARQERGDSQRRGERTPRACVSPCSCVSSPSLQNRTFVPNHWITHERLPAMSWLLPLGCTLKLSILIKKGHILSCSMFILLAMHKVEMQKEVKPVDCWLRSDPGNLGLPSTASQ